jgi:hypothetical protein
VLLGGSTYTFVVLLFEYQYLVALLFLFAIFLLNKAMTWDFQGCYACSGSFSFVLLLMKSHFLLSKKIIDLSSLFFVGILI